MKKISRFITPFFLALTFCVVAAGSASAAVDSVAKVSTISELAIALEDRAITTIDFTKNITAKEVYVVNHPVSIRGNGYTLVGGFLIEADNVKIKNLTVDASALVDIDGDGVDAIESPKHEIALDGEVTLLGGNTTENHAYGGYAVDAYQVLILRGAKVNATGGTALTGDGELGGTGGAAVWANRNVTLQNFATLTALGGGGDIAAGYGVGAYNELNLQPDSTVNATAGSGKMLGGIAVYSKNDLTVSSGAAINATGSPSVFGGYGIWAVGNMSVEAGASVVSEGGSGSIAGDGICVEKNLTLQSGATLRGIGAQSPKASGWGISVGRELTAPKSAKITGISGGTGGGTIRTGEAASPQAEFSVKE